MQDIVTIFQYTFWIAVFCSVIYTAIDTPLRPVQNLIASWRDSFIYAFRHYRVALCITLVYLLGPCLDFFLGLYGGMNRARLIELAAVWQMFAAGILAVIAVRVHFWAGLDVFEREHARYEPNRRREIWAAAIGIGVVFITLTAAVALGAFLRIVPARWLPIGALLSNSLRTLVFAVLSLIRPCLSLGARRPIHAALIGFSRRPLGFFLWITVLGVPAVFAEYAISSFVEASADPLPFWSARLAMTSFQVVNFIAFEMTTLRMVQDLSLAPEEDFRLGVDESL